jgi:hypothetical protein
MKIALVGAAGAIIGGAMVAFVDYVVREREIDVKMVEIAVGLLREDPKGPLQPARQWAVEVIDDLSGIKLTPAARAALVNCPVDLSDVFGRIGATAMAARGSEAFRDCVTAPLPK